MTTSSRLRTYAAIAFFVILVSAATGAEQIDQSNLPEWAGGWTHVITETPKPTDREKTL